MNGANNVNRPRSCWINHPANQPPIANPSASVIEYLRWMRIQEENPSNNSQIGLINNGTVLEVIDEFETRHDYTETLTRLCDRTRRLATETFEAEATWRIRVGGMRGPESMLLPAFDALGMPYLPSSTLKGIARSMAKQDPSATPKEIRLIFGEIDPDPQMGQVIFLDAYPLPDLEDSSEYPDEEAVGIVPDLANSIWTWNGGTPQYKTNPNIFFSLRRIRFVIGLRSGQGCTPEMLEKTQRWLIQGLAQGIGSRVNSGYGVLTVASNQVDRDEDVILSVKFDLRGQLSHGRQEFNEWQQRDNGEWKPPGLARPEVRPPAFRSMLRYWFRTLTLGVLEPAEVQRWELIIFGGIDPSPKVGVFQLEIPDGVIRRDNARFATEDEGWATGTLILRHSLSIQELTPEQQTACNKLLKYLTWLMVQLGGVGQGARRPHYSRQSRPRMPYWRGSTLTVRSDDEFWRAPSVFHEPAVPLIKRLRHFYGLLHQITAQSTPLASSRLKVAPNSGSWAEAIDRNCRILYVQGDMAHDKPPALALLHRLARRGNSYDRELCGAMQERSPIWISHVGTKRDRIHNLVTVFGANNGRRSEYVRQLESNQYPVTSCQPIWPLPPRQ